jgi:hypothetical protein
LLVESFREQLFKGLGAPLLHLISHSNKPQKKYIHTIVQACVRNTAYDPQAETERTEYLYEAVKYSGFSSRIQKEVLDHLLSSEEEYDTQQMLRLARRFAEEGNEEAREAIRKSFQFSQAWNCFIGDEELIAIDKQNGLKRVVEVIGKKIVDDDYVEIDFTYNFAIEQLGEDAVDVFFRSQSHHLYVSAYLNSVMEYRNRESSRTPYELIPYEEIRDSILQKDTSKHRFFYHFWGKKASDNDLRLAAEDLLKQTNEKKLCLYLNIFQKRKFPLSEDFLLSLARSPKKSISNYAILALRNIESEAVHEFALELLQDEQPHHYALELLELNYKQQDITIVERILLKKQNKDAFHDRALDVKHIFEKQKDPSSIDLILQIYREGRCTSCREGFIDILIANHWLPSIIWDELLYDSNLDIREKVRRYRRKESD